jgi:hypothetical protein
MVVVTGQLAELADQTVMVMAVVGLVKAAVLEVIVALVITPVAVLVDTLVMALIETVNHLQEVEQVLVVNTQVLMDILQAAVQGY